MKKRNIIVLSLFILLFLISNSNAETNDLPSYIGMNIFQAIDNYEQMHMKEFKKDDPSFKSKGSVRSSMHKSNDIFYALKLPDKNILGVFTLTVDKKSNKVLAAQISGAYIKKYYNFAGGCGDFASFFSSKYNTPKMKKKYDKRMDENYHCINQDHGYKIKIWCTSDGKEFELLLSAIR